MSKCAIELETIQPYSKNNQAFHGSDLNRMIDRQNPIVGFLFGPIQFPDPQSEKPLASGRKVGRSLFESQFGSEK